MEKITLKEIIEEVVGHGIEVVIYKDEDSGKIRYYSSDGFDLSESNGQVTDHRAPGGKRDIEDMEDLFLIYMSRFRVRQKRYGVRVMEPEWESLWSDLGFLKVDKEVTEKVIREEKVSYKCK